MREILDSGPDGLTIQKFKEDCNIHLAVNSCVTHGYLSGVIQLDTTMEIALESEVEDTITSLVWWSLRNLMKMPVHKELRGGIDDKCVHQG